MSTKTSPRRAAARNALRLDVESAAILAAMDGRCATSYEALAETAGLSMRTVMRRVELLKSAGLARGSRHGVIAA